MKHLFTLLFLVFISSKLTANFKTLYFLPEQLKIAPTLSKIHNHQIPLIKATVDDKSSKKSSHLEETHYYTTYGYGSNDLPKRAFYFEVELFDKVKELLQSIRGRPFLIELSKVDEEYKLRAVKNAHLFRIWKTFIHRLKKQVNARKLHKEANHQSKQRSSALTNNQ